jgi:hypothetical protein|tara:strand:- start:251 stop:1132 length:882 start_codon:yes stop_codon:yes gene_type:complete
MDDNTARELLNTVRQVQAKEAGFFSGGTSRAEDARLTGLIPQQAASNRTSNIIKALLLAGAGGVALRGGLGLSRMFGESKPTPSRTIDMPITYPVGEEEEEKSAETIIERFADKLGLGPNSDPQATSPSGVGYYLPALLAGTPLAAYAGWKGMDVIFDKQRKEKTKNKLEKAKKEYEDSLLNSYKTAADSSSPINHLDKVFDEFEKLAFNPLDVIRDLFPNAPGQAKGLAATYALLSAPAAYMYVNDKMKKNSKRTLLEKAMKERARRQAMQQPAELYAIPQPESNTEEEYLI